jgi:SAM-dependent MidA family methyltransferase
VSLREKIECEIREHGRMPFSRYMELCLYDPELGYYSRNAEQFGKAGDFYTSSDVHAVFGRLLARQFEEMWRALDSPEQIEILELGPGRGLFANDVLDWSKKKFPYFFHALHYSLAERSPSLQVRLRQTLNGFLEGEKSSVICDRTPATIRGRDQHGKGTALAVPNNVALHRALAPEVPLIIFANEFFDALPVEVLSSQGQLHIEVHDGRLRETWCRPSPEALEFLGHYSVHPEPGERVEVPLITQDYLAQAASLIKPGFLLIIDYGYTREEQLAGRHRGTLSAFRLHSVSANPYEAPGEQDITAHVNFTALAAAAEQNGMHIQPLLTQSQFLMGIGQQNQFADAFEECRLPQERAKVALQLKHLVTPAGMGESFHVLVASKEVSPDRVCQLTGMSFGKASFAHN